MFLKEKYLGINLQGMVYDQYDYIPEQQEAADKWAQKVT